MEQNSGEQQGTTVNVTIPTVEGIIGWRPFSPASFALAFVFFLFTFCDFNCSGTRIASLKGIDMVKGTSIQQPSLFGPSKSQKIPPAPWAILAFVSSIVGFGLYFTTKKEKNILAAGVGAIGAAALLILQYVISDKIDKEGQGQIVAEFTFAYWGAFLAFVAAAVFNFTKAKRDDNFVLNINTGNAGGVSIQKSTTSTGIQKSQLEQLEEFYKLKENGLITEEEFNEQKAKILGKG
jgi:hypothetical protein